MAKHSVDLLSFGFNVSIAQIEGPTSPEQMLTVLQRVIEESTPVLLTVRLDAEERRSNIRLREEQDDAYQAALEADQARERQRQEEQERLEREAVEAERKCKDEEEAQERAAHEVAEKEVALARRRQEKAKSLGAELEKGPNVTQAGWKLWPFAHLITYGVIPLEQRLLWVDCVELIWVTILSTYSNEKSEARHSEEELETKSVSQSIGPSEE